MKKPATQKDLVGAVAIVAIFTAGRVFGGWGWWVVFPIVFGGVLPIVSVLSERYSPTARARREAEAQQIEGKREKQLLSIAREHNGRLSVALVALHSDLSLADADLLLQKLSAKGHAQMNVLDDGRIEYVIPDLLPGK
ncbi:MAG: hypothetical protein EA428_09260 [Spirochaetaceae bacterium]|nr:MAG: hypothetical protein EA428_09260 [Spirochaetaceae bacterium]